MLFNRQWLQWAVSLVKTDRLDKFSLKYETDKKWLWPVHCLNSRGPEESDTLIKESGFVYSDTYKWQEKAKK